ncbi:hypothetical protein RCL1_007856 [Eukaryota sp. TZLM3-RCL]
MGFDLSESRFELAYSALGKLFSDEILKPSLFEFVSLKLFPFCVEESHLKDNTITQQLNTITELDRQLVDKNCLLAIPSVQNAVKHYQEAREDELKRQEIEQRTLRCGLKFLSSNRGSNIIWSDNRLVATKTGDGGWENSFVAIKNPAKGKVFLTLLNFEKDFATCIGFFDRCHLQNRFCFHNAHSLLVHGAMTQFFHYHDISGPSKSGPISKATSHCEVHPWSTEVTFSIPSLGYSHTVTWPSGYVFGLAMFCPSTS